MSDRKTWIKGKMHFPPDVDPADIDWVVPVVAYPKPEKERNSFAVISEAYEQRTSTIRANAPAELA